MDAKFNQVAALGAADFAHINGNLIDHLQGTKELLASWSASKVLQDAGLYHAAYGTAGFEEQMVAANQREKIAQIIGPQAEEIVYQYCACDRDYFWPQLGIAKNPTFRNRFTLQTYPLKPQALKDFCELTVANELEIAMGGVDFVTQHGGGLLKLFTHMAPFLSPRANSAITRVLG
jgi:hypothetical protein